MNPMSTAIKCLPKHLNQFLYLQKLRSIKYMHEGKAQLTQPRKYIWKHPIQITSCKSEGHKRRETSFLDAENSKSISLPSYPLLRCLSCKLGCILVKYYRRLAVLYDPVGIFLPLLPPPLAFPRYALQPSVRVSEGSGEHRQPSGKDTGEAGKDG